LRLILSLLKGERAEVGKSNLLNAEDGRYVKRREEKINRASSDKGNWETQAETSGFTLRGGNKIGRVSGLR